MLAKPCHHLVPIQSLSPAKLHPVHRISSSPSVNIPRAVSISTSGSNVSTLQPTQDVNESVTAFWDYQFLFMSQRAETLEPITLQIVDGEIPLDFPLGTYYLTGPGLFTDDHGSTVHPLDGHGYLRSFTIDGATREVKFMAKYVKTEAQVEECDPETGAWRFTYRGPFSVLRGGKKIGNTKVMKNVANTSVLRWGGKLLCLWEGGEPYEIKSGTLDTVGRFDMIKGLDSTTVSGGFNGDVLDVAAGLLKPILNGVFKMPPKRLLSHYKTDIKRERLLLMSCNTEDMLLPRSNFTFYEYDSNFKLLQQQDFNIPDHTMIHDWAFTDTHYILFANRIKLDIIGSMAAVCGLSPMISALSVDPSKQTSSIYMFPRFSNEKGRDWRIPIEAPFQLWLLHVGNAFEEKDDNGNSKICIHASSCSYQWFNFHKMFGYDWQSGKLDPSFMNVKECDKELLPHLVQVSINLDANENCQKCCVAPLEKWTNPSDFPAINTEFSGSENKYIYAATSSGSRQTLPHFPFDMVVKINAEKNSTHTWSVGPRRFIGEPIFIPKGVEEDDGYLLVVEYAVAIQKCFLVILDPKKIGEVGALVARLEVPRHLNFPLGFHGFWATNE